MESLEKEVKIWKKLQHERIVQYYGIEISGKKLNIFIEYMPGVSMWVNTIGVFYVNVISLINAHVFNS